jgi:hypothetical protein
MVKAATPAPAGAPPARRATRSGKESPFYVPPLVDVLGAWVHEHRPFWLWLGRVESGLLADRLPSVPVTMPVYVCGLARSGSTLLHEIVAAHPRVATHRVKDYPLVYTPYWWRRATAGLRPAAPRERAHQDRVMITSDSPEAVEEMVWTAFFPRCHDPAVSNLLGAADRRPAFEEFYNNHIRKLLLAEGATRYLAKANYHVARLPYLRRLFPDAKFVVPVREPAGHITSLMRQHRWFSDGHRRYPRSLAYMRRSGHFEFGLDRRPMNLGDGARVRAILDLWARGAEVRGWARYWDMVYAYLHRLLASDAPVRGAAIVVRYEDVCDAPAENIRRVMDHCALPDVGAIIDKFAPGISRPEYYKQSFTPAELAAIREETAETANRWGYA